MFETKVHLSVLRFQLLTWSRNRWLFCWCICRKKTTWSFLIGSSQVFILKTMKKHSELVAFFCKRKGKPHLSVSPPNRKPSSYLSKGLRKSVGLVDLTRPQDGLQKLNCFCCFVWWLGCDFSLVKQWTYWSPTKGFVSVLRMKRLLKSCQWLAKIAQPDRTSKVSFCTPHLPNLKTDPLSRY